MESPIKIYVELLDEGTETWRKAQAVALPNGLFKLLEPENYDPEDEQWPFLPGSEVRLVEAKHHMGAVGLVAKHPNPEAVEILVDSAEKFAPPSRETYALPLGDGLYEVLATPHYTPEQLWEFPPGSTVRLQPVKTSFPGWNPVKAIAP